MFRLLSNYKFMKNGRDYELCRINQDGIYIIESIHREKISMFGSPFNHVYKFCMVGDEPYLHVNLEKEGDYRKKLTGHALLDIYGIPFLGFGGPIYEVREIKQFNNQILLNGAIINSDGNIEHNVFRNDGKVMFPSDFYAFGSLDINKMGVFVQAKRKPYDDMFYYNTDGLSNMDRTWFYRVAKAVPHQESSSLHICQKRKDSHLKLYDSRNDPFFPETIIDESLVGKVARAYINMDGSYCFLFDEYDVCLSLLPIENQIMLYGLEGSHRKVLSSINGLQLKRTDMLQLLTAYADTLIQIFEPYKGDFVSRLGVAKDRLESMADTLDNYPSINMIDFMGVS